MSAPAEKRTILIVEDDPDAAILMQMTFEEEGFSVACAQTGKDHKNITRDILRLN